MCVTIDTITVIRMISVVVMIDTFIDAIRVASVLIECLRDMGYYYGSRLSNKIRVIFFTDLLV